MSPKAVRELDPSTVLGVVALAAWTAWAIAAGTSSEGSLTDTGTYLLAPLSAGGGVLLGRWLNAKKSEETAPLLLVLMSLLLAIAARGGIGGGLLGYPNATAALALQLTALAALVMVGRSGRARWCAGLGVAGGSVLVLLTLSRAGAVLLVPLLLVSLLATLRGVRTRIWPVILGVAGSATVAVTVLWLAGRVSWPAAATSAFDSTRRQLWADALQLWTFNPVMGSGPGSFRAFSALAEDPDTQRVHMSLLQVGAELGIVGVALFGLLVAVGFALATRGAPSASLVAVAAISVLLIHSFVDHVLEFPGVMLAAGAVVGWASREHA